MGFFLVGFGFGVKTSGDSFDLGRSRLVSRVAPGLAEMTVVFVGFPVHMLVGALRSMMTMLFCTGRRMTKGLVFESQGIPGSSSLDASWRV